eukprot:scaffold8068_cov565-Prasinococcus_capsulatus_cf.AAC.5
MRRGRGQHPRCDALLSRSRSQEQLVDSYVVQATRGRHCRSVAKWFTALVATQHSGDGVREGAATILVMKLPTPGDPDRCSTRLVAAFVQLTAAPPRRRACVCTRTRTRAAPRPRAGELAPCESHLASRNCDDGRAASGGAGPTPNSDSNP